MLFTWTVLYLAAKGAIGPLALKAALLLCELWWTACLAGLFRKAGVSPVWAVVPVCRFWKLARVGFGSGVWGIFWLVPVLNVFWMLRFDRLLAARYGMSPTFGTCMFFVPVVFYIWLAFGPGCVYAAAPCGSGRSRDARGYEGGGYVEGLYDGPDAKQSRKDAEKEELRRRYERRYRN